MRVIALALVLQFCGSGCAAVFLGSELNPSREFDQAGPWKRAWLRAKALVEGESRLRVEHRGPPLHRHLRAQVMTPDPPLDPREAVDFWEELGPRPRWRTGPTPSSPGDAAPDPGSRSRGRPAP